MITKEQMQEAIDRGLSSRGIAKYLNFAQATVNWYLEKYKLKTKCVQFRKEPVWIPILKTSVENSKSIADLLRRLNLNVRPGNYDTVKKWIKKLDITTNHFLGQGHGKTKSTGTISNEEMFKENSRVTRQSLKNKIIKENIIPYVCSECGRGPDWEGKPLVLVLDHINGKPHDCRIENIRFLCPNCNSQQETFCRGYKNTGS